ncbi:MAG TPA: lipid-A-disaccharide synthase N-terminal domain-containing protein [Gemmatimonadaceae bacterium]|nr:lipid-A-disaccharide synthase N-terminal domain-containing protein [Gemmatimonadaceae bacterium]
MDSSNLWLGIGFLGQSLFSARFIVQWLVSEKRRRSVTPVAFWYFSLAGGVILLAYAIHRRDKVFMVGQATGLFVYVRNLMLILRARRTGDADAVATPSPDTTER